MVRTLQVGRSEKGSSRALAVHANHRYPLFNRCDIRDILAVWHVRVVLSVCNKKMPPIKLTVRPCACNADAVLRVLISCVRLLLQFSADRFFFVAKGAQAVLHTSASTAFCLLLCWTILHSALAARVPPHAAIPPPNALQGVYQKGHDPLPVFSDRFVQVNVRGGSEA